MNARYLLAGAFVVNKAQVPIGVEKCIKVSSE